VRRDSGFFSTAGAAILIESLLSFVGISPRILVALIWQGQKVD